MFGSLYDKDVKHGISAQDERDCSPEGQHNDDGSRRSCKSAICRLVMIGLFTGYMFQPGVCRLTNYFAGPKYLRFLFSRCPSRVASYEVGAYTPCVGLGGLDDLALHLI